MAQVPSYAGQGTLYVLETGTFSVSGGQPTGLSFSVDETIKATITGLSYDCDIHGSGSAQYEGP